MRLFTFQNKACLSVLDKGVWKSTKSHRLKCIDNDYVDWDNDIYPIYTFASYGIKYNSPTEHDPVVDQNMWNEVRKIDHFYDKLKPVEGSVELFNNLSAKYECQILTAIPKEKWNIPDAKEDKINWAKRYLGDDVKINTVYRPEKKDFVKGSQSILVDDLPQNIQEWEAEGGTGIHRFKIF